MPVKLLTFCLGLRYRTCTFSASSTSTKKSRRAILLLATQIRTALVWPWILYVMMLSINLMNFLEYDEVNVQADLLAYKQLP
jgi:hypothetical protein